MGVAMTDRDEHQPDDYQALVSDEGKAPQATLLHALAAGRDRLVREWTHTVVDGAIYPGPTGRLWLCQVLPDGTVDFIPLE